MNGYSGQTVTAKYYSELSVPMKGGVEIKTPKEAMEISFLFFCKTKYKRSQGW